MQPCCLVLRPPQAVRARSWCALIPTRAEVVEWLSGSMGTTESPVCGTGEPSVWYRCYSSSRDRRLQKTWVIPAQYWAHMVWGKDWAWGGCGASHRSFLFPAHACREWWCTHVKHFELHLLALCSLAFDIVLTCFLGRNIVCL